MENKQSTTWLQPNQGELKLNVDGAIFPDYNKAGVGCILRDEKGSAVMAATKLEEHSNDLLEIELMALF